MHLQVFSLIVLTLLMLSPLFLNASSEDIVLREVSASLLISSFYAIEVS